jgi:hypothetical protein
MNMNPLTLEYLHKANQQEINKKLKFKYKYKLYGNTERHKICVDLKIFKFCI